MMNKPPLHLSLRRFSLIVFLVAFLAFLLLFWNDPSRRDNTLLKKGEVVGTTVEPPKGDDSVDSSQKANHSHTSTSTLLITKPQDAIKAVECPDDKEAKVPDFIIAGAQKAGTTAFLGILARHPALRKAVMLKAGTREVHYFDNHPKREQPASTLSDKEICFMRKEYRAKWDEADQLSVGNKWLYEKTPNYMFHPNVPARVKAVCPWVKILVILRNPLDRAFSQYKMYRDKANKLDGPNAKFPSFEELIDSEIDELRRYNLTKAPSLKNFRAEEDQGNPWILPSSLEDRAASQEFFKGYISRGMYAQQLAYWKQHFHLGKTLKVICYERFKSNPEEVMQEVIEFLDISPMKFESNVLHHNYHPSKADDEMNNKTKMYLKRLYKPYNEELVPILGEEWRGIWDADHGPSGEPSFGTNSDAS